MLVQTKDGTCRQCGGQLKIIDADDATMTVECQECGDSYLWLNDATSPDGAQEFSVVKKAGPNGRPWQVESITVSWCDYAELLAYVERTLRGEDDQNDFAHEVAPALQTPAEHGRCCHCA